MHTARETSAGFALFESRLSPARARASVAFFYFNRRETVALALRDDLTPSIESPVASRELACLLFNVISRVLEFPR